jgi:hypothetical protein
VWKPSKACLAERYWGKIWRHSKVFCTYMYMSDILLMYVYVSVYVHVHVHAHVHVYMYVCIYVCNVMNM